VRREEKRRGMFLSPERGFLYFYCVDLPGNLGGESQANNNSAN
jgi:hypothetical protein